MHSYTHLRLYSLLTPPTCKFGERICLFLRVLRYMGYNAFLRSCYANVIAVAAVIHVLHFICVGVFRFECIEPIEVDDIKEFL